MTSLLACLQHILFSSYDSVLEIILNGIMNMYLGIWKFTWQEQVATLTFKNTFYPVYPYHNDIITLFPSGGRISSCKGKLYLYLYRTGFKDPFRLTVVGIWKKCYKNVNDRCYVTGFRNKFLF